MSFEVAALGWMGLLQAVYLGVYAILANRTVGITYSLSSREETRELTGIAGRSKRALINQFEASSFFLLGISFVILSGQSTQLTCSLAAVVLAARTAYLPAYLFALSPWRSLIWGTGFLANVTLFILPLIFGS